MVYWIKRLANILAVSAFFVIFFAGINPVNPFDMLAALAVMLRGVLGASLFWFGGFVIGDIILKGVVEDIPDETIDVLEGGMLQRVRESKAVRENAILKPEDDAEDDAGTDKKKSKPRKKGR
ncbi:MAG: hypothetical protein GF344_07100 [Chitinivibrionales bacterium]|nr:hypothetical protein [Chitinivibrionales bacterium]MBD3356679.1 hypothetical protein [Chitinivibrionales bacterium]